MGAIWSATVNDETQTLLDHLCEECAEVIQAVNKARRFGMDSDHKGSTNRQRLVQEVGDVIAVIAALNIRHPDLLSDRELEQACQRKVARLRKHIPSLHDFVIPEENTDVRPTDVVPDNQGQ